MSFSIVIDLNKFCNYKNNLDVNVQDWFYSKLKDYGLDINNSEKLENDVEVKLWYSQRSEKHFLLTIDDSSKITVISGITHAKSVDYEENQIVINSFERTMLSIIEKTALYKIRKTYSIKYEIFNFGDIEFKLGIIDRNQESKVFFLVISYILIDFETNLNRLIELFIDIFDDNSRDLKKDLLINEILSSEVMVKLSNLLNEKSNSSIFSNLEKNEFRLDFNYNTRKYSNIYVNVKNNWEYFQLISYFASYDLLIGI